jgi:uncharacterized membrane protein YbhN (UPF0104 family)
MKLTAIHKKIINYALGTIVSIWVSAAIYKQVSGQQQLKDTMELVTSHWSMSRIFSIISVFILMIINWSIEALKWKRLLFQLEDISFTRSIRSVFTGISVSILTPNRIGEYAGRIIYLKEVNRLSGITANIVGSLAQFIAAGTFGIIGALYYLIGVQFTWWLLALILGSSLVILVFIYLYQHLEVVVRLAESYKFFKKMKKYILIAQTYNRKQLLELIVLSALRYLVFAFQYFILLKIYYVDIAFLPALLTIFLIFWSMAIIPSITLAELPVRSQVSFYFLAVYSSNALGMHAASFSLWLVNLILPAMLGVFLIIGARIFGGDDDE